MAIIGYVRNYTPTDTTRINHNITIGTSRFVGYDSTLVQDWTRDGEILDSWNTSRDGTGNKYYVRELIPSGVNEVYAIWRKVEKYTTDENELISIAEAIRYKTSTYDSLVYPSGFISAINGFNTDYLKIIDRKISSFVDSYVTTVGTYAFAGCTLLKLVDLPNCSVISASAFSNAGLQSANFPMCSKVGIGAFQDCAISVSLSMPNLTTVEYSAFTRCYLKRADFSKLSKIDAYAFSGCSYLSYVSLPAWSFITVGANGVFANCSSLTEVHLDNLDISATSANTVGSNMFTRCINLSNISLPKISRLPNGFFASCFNLNSVSLPSCSIIGSNAFQDCRSLASISLPECTYINSYAFYGASSLSWISAPKTISIYNSAFASLSLLLSVDFPVVEIIGSSAFQSCQGLSIASLGSKLTNIGGFAFRYCNNLLSLYIYASSVVELLGQAAGIFSYTPIYGYTSSTGGVYGSVYVPASLVDAYKSASYWSEISSRITSIPE